MPLPADFDYETCSATFYPISRCYVHNFDDPKCPRNANYRQKLYGWTGDPKRHYRGKLVIGEYYNVSRYKSLPLCLMHGMAHDIPYYYQAGARCFQYMHVTTGHWGNKSLTNYQMARQLWDVHTDCESLWKDFFARRYGPAADLMRRFYESLEQMLSNVEPLKGWSSNLASRLEAGDKDLFVEPHLRYRREPGVPCDAPTLVEMVETRPNLPPTDRPSVGFALARADQGPDRRGRADVHLRPTDAGLLRPVRAGVSLGQGRRAGGGASSLRRGQADRRPLAAGYPLGGLGLCPR